MSKKILDFILIRIKYDHTVKEYDKINTLLDYDEFKLIKEVNNNRINKTIKKRNNISDWILLKEDEIKKIEEILEKYKIRYKITDHTETYLYKPEKLTVLREEIDIWMKSLLNLDFILDRISEVGYENISTLERKFLDKESKK